MTDPPRRKNPAAVALGRMRSPKKAAAARRNGLKGGGPGRAPLRWCVLSVPGTGTARPTWYAFDRATRASERAPTYHAARALVRAYNSAPPPTKETPA